ncbi:MAG: TauD/TfdA dioxygenase family protein [Myxococcota bacterium]|nr:taurine dioxygenase [Spirochaeta sp.]RPG05718.1 MAG: TauD/TfdA family dioxygenase [Proteobacteria bacterium TMED72]
MNLNVRPLGNIGVEVLDVDLREPVGDDLKAALEALWLEYGVLAFRDQEMDVSHQIAFSSIFGELARHPLEVKLASDHPELFVLDTGSNPARDEVETSYWDGVPLIGRLPWHIDLHYTGRPNRGAVMRSVTAEEGGGNTGFCDLAMAYDALDAATQERIQGLEVTYVFEMQRSKWRFADLEGFEPGPKNPKKPSDVGFPDFPDSVYPVVVTHPVSGRKVLEVVEQFLDRFENAADFGLTGDEADALLQELLDHVRQPQFQYIHEWKPGDIVLWDNWRTAHCGTGTPIGTRRLLHRTTIVGDVALGRHLDA